MCLGSQDPEEMLVNKQAKQAAVESYILTNLSIDDVLSLRPAALCDIAARLPKLSLSGWLFVSAHAHQLRSKFDALLSECTLLHEEIEPLKGRFPLLEPRGIALNREWFKRDGEERREELKGLMEGFKAAAPGDDGAQDLVKVEEMLKFMLEMVGRAKVKVTALRDVLGQYSMLSVLNIMNM